MTSTTSTTADGRRTTQGRLKLVLLIGGLSMFAPLSMDLYLPALPALTRDAAVALLAGLGGTHTAVPMAVVIALVEGAAVTTCAVLTRSRPHPVPSGSGHATADRRTTLPAPRRLLVSLDDGATAGVVATAAAHRAMEQEASAVIARQVIDSSAWPAGCWACPVSRCR